MAIHKTPTGGQDMKLTTALLFGSTILTLICSFSPHPEASPKSRGATLVVWFWFGAVPGCVQSLLMAAFRDHAWWSLENHVWYQGWNPIASHATRCMVISLASSGTVWGTNVPGSDPALPYAKHVRLCSEHLQSVFFDYLSA